MSRFVRFRLIMPALLVVALAALLASSALAAPKPRAQPSSLVVPPSWFNPNYSSVQYSKGNLLRTISGGGHEYSAPLQLPQGAEITKMTIVYRDEVVQDIAVAIRYYRSPNVVEVFATVRSTGSSSQGVISTAEVPITAEERFVDNENNGYDILAVVPPETVSFGLGLHGVKIDYNLPH